MTLERNWRHVTPVAFAAIGALLALTATASGGTELRTESRTDLASLIDEHEAALATDDAVRRQRQREIDSVADGLAAADERIAAPRQQRANLQEAIGQVAVTGPAVSVALDDAPRSGQPPAGATPEDLVVHQQDVQAVVNALWAGGAEAMTIMGQRIIATSAIRCVGNTLLLDGRTYAPPFRITAIGDPAKLQRALAESSGVRAFQQASRQWGLGYRVTSEPHPVTLPAYQGSTNLPNSKTSP